MRLATKRSIIHWSTSSVLGRTLAATVFVSVIALYGCVNVKAPERIVIGGRQFDDGDRGRGENENHELSRDDDRLEHQGDD